MKSIIIATLGLGALAQAQEPTKPAEKTAEAPAAAQLSPEEAIKRASMAIGYEFGMQLHSVGIQASDLDKEAYLKGFLSAFAGEKPAFSPEETMPAMQAMETRLREREEKLGKENLEKGKAFLAENAKKEGVTTTASGLQYQIIKKGTGKTYVEPKELKGADDTQTEFHLEYTGTLIDGTEFDASPKGETVPFTLQIVPGVAEALRIMPIGSTWKLFIPSKLAYGERRNGAILGPNSTLIFEITLKDIGKAKPQLGLPPGFQLPSGSGPAPAER